MDMTLPPSSLGASVVWSSHICYKKTPRKGYTDYCGMLLCCSASSPNRLELYENGELVGSRHPQLVIELDNVLCVRPMEMKGKTKLKRYEFQVLATNTKHQFATNEAEECRTWVKKLNRLLFGPPENGVLYEFRVEVLQTSHSNKLGLHGYYVMRVSDTAIVLYSASGILPTQFHCSLNGIIQAHYSKVIESGRKQTILVIKTNKNAEIGEGGYAFYATKAADVIMVIEYRRSQWSQNQTGEQSAATGTFPKAPRLTRSSPMTHRNSSSASELASLKLHKQYSERDNSARLSPFHSPSHRNPHSPLPRIPDGSSYFDDVLDRAHASLSPVQFSPTANGASSIKLEQRFPPDTTGRDGAGAKIHEASPDCCEAASSPPPNPPPRMSSLKLLSSHDQSGSAQHSPLDSRKSSRDSPGTLSHETIGEWLETPTQCGILPAGYPKVISEGASSALNTEQRKIRQRRGQRCSSLDSLLDCEPKHQPFMDGRVNPTPYAFLDYRPSNKVAPYSVLMFQHTNSHSKPSHDFCDYSIDSRPPAPLPYVEEQDDDDATPVEEIGSYFISGHVTPSPYLEFVPLAKQKAPAEVEYVNLQREHP